MEMLKALMTLKYFKEEDEVVEDSVPIKII